MINQLSFRTKITFLVAVGVLMAGLLLFAAYMGISKLNNAVSEQSESAFLLRSGLMGDMMHDAINADVMSALLASLKQVIDPKAKEDAISSFQEHDKIFRQQLANLSQGKLNQEELIELNQAKADVTEYLRGADNIITLAFQDRNAAEQQVPVFEKQFRSLEVSLEKLGDTLESKIKTIEGQGKAAGKLAYQLLYVATLIGLAMMGIVSFMITRALIQELGGEPRKIHEIAAGLSVGDLNVATPVKPGDTGSVMFAMGRIKRSLSDLIDDTETLTAGVMSGNLAVRSDNNKHQGAYGQLLHGINQTLDSVIDPLNMTAGYIDLISKGEIPPKIATNGGDLSIINTIKKNLNTTIDTLNYFIADMQHMAEQHDRGDIDVVLDSDHFKGSYKVMAQGVNSMVAEHILVKKKAMACIKAFGEGDFDAKLEQFPGKKAFINETIEQVRNNLKALIEDAYWLAAEAQEGNLSVRADASRHQGDFRKIIAGINNALDSIVLPIQEAIEQITLYSRGDMSGKLEAEYKGDFAELKKRLNYLAMTMKGVIDSVAYVTGEHDKGDIDIDIASERFKGEFGKMANNINVLINSHIDLNKKAMACVKEFGEGNFEAHLETFPGKKAFINDTIEQVRRNLQGLIADTDMLSQASQDGRIQVRAEAHKHHGDFRKIVEGINATLESIVSPIITVKAAVDSISTAAKEISAGNADLSHRTEQQAASLEETASSMEQLASTVKQNAENAKQANEMALAASGIAAKGGTMVQQVVETMSSINESSRKIVDIISVIDGIALQTNILALNAAVEAARAGEQGRGFAVVASEVRNLAQRSAAAAKEIKGLIGDSVDKVEDGSKLVGEAGKTMSEIVASVKRVTDIMVNIAAASEQQSAGISQVNHAVSQMDDVTQQNAALVEQAAAAAESLEEQAETLSETVSQFRLEGDNKAREFQTKKYVKVQNKTTPILKRLPEISLSKEESEWTEF
jgi:methyl-accepting chemotaxis protein